MNTLEILKAGRALLADPANWTQGSLAKTKDGTSVEPLDFDACSWCSVGVIMHINPGQPVKPIRLHLERALPPNPFDMDEDNNIVGYNDSHSHAEVLAVWDRAIQNASA